MRKVTLLRLLKSLQLMPKLNAWEVSFIPSVLHVVKENRRIFAGISSDHIQTLDNILEHLPEYVKELEGEYERGKQDQINFMKEELQKIVDSESKGVDLMLDVIAVLQKLKPTE